MDDSFTPYVPSAPAARHDAYTWLLWGTVAFAIVTALVILLFVVGGKDLRDDNVNFVLSLYLIPHMLNVVAAYKLFTALRNAYWHIGQKIFLYLCYAVFAVFAALTMLLLPTYLIQALHIQFFDTILRQMYGTDTLYLVGQGWLNAYDLWLVSFPLQVLTWLSLAVTVHVIRKSARRLGRPFLEGTRDLRALYHFFFLALGALGVLVYVISNTSWW